MTFFKSQQKCKIHDFLYFLILWFATNWTLLFKIDIDPESTNKQANMLYGAYMQWVKFKKNYLKKILY